MDVVFKEGMLYYQSVKFGKKVWRKMWMVLFKPSSTGVGRLELYSIVANNAISDLKKAGWHKSPARKVIRLSDCLSITSAPKESCPSGCEAFVLNTMSCIYTLASDTSQNWISALCLLAFEKDPEDADKGDFDRGNGFIMEDNELYCSWKRDTNLPPNVYQVTVRCTEASQRCNLIGDYLISLESDALLLLDGNTSDIIYCWPYKMIRKYGQVEGGFSIQAGRRCESGEGKFIFLSKQAPHIFQVISQQCSEKTVYAQQLNTQPLFDQSTIYSPIATEPSASSPCYKAADSAPGPPADESLHCYSNLTDCFKQLSLDRAHSRVSGEAVAEETVDEDDPFPSPEAEDLDDTTEECIYYNLKRSVCMKDPFLADQDISECFYSCANKHEYSLNPPLEPAPVQLASCLVPKPRLYPQPVVNNSIQPVYGAQTQAADNMKETEEATGHSTPTELPGSFKQRLAEIISKDLAKLQPPLFSGVNSPTFFQ